MHPQAHTDMCVSENTKHPHLSSFSLSKVSTNARLSMRSSRVAHLSCMASWIARADRESTMNCRIRISTKRTQDSSIPPHCLYQADCTIESFMHTRETMDMARTSHSLHASQNLHISPSRKSEILVGCSKWSNFCTTARKAKSYHKNKFFPVLKHGEVSYNAFEIQDSSAEGELCHSFWKTCAESRNAEKQCMQELTCAQKSKSAFPRTLPDEIVLAWPFDADSSAVL